MKLFIFSFFLIGLLCLVLQMTNCSCTLTMKNKKKSTEKMSLFDYNKKLFENNFKTFFYKHIAENFKFIGVDSKLSTEINKKITKNDDDILALGWVKFLEISELSKEPPSTFKKNNMYFLQMSENPGISTLAKDNVGYVNISNEEYFFAQLSDTNLKILTARNERYKRLEKILKISDLVPQENISTFKGGVEDVGNFEEGFCFMVKFTTNSKLYIWELCTDSIYEKEKWMKVLEDLNKKNSNKNNNGSNSKNSSFNSFPVLRQATHITQMMPIQQLVPIPQVITVGQSPYPMVLGRNSGTVTASTKAIGFNGYQVSGAWSDCSKSCGSGVQSRIWLCVDEKVCKGKRLEDRMCNLQACKEEIESGLNNLKKATQGQWEYLGTWSDCSAPCGGGLQTISRRCKSGSCTGMEVVTQSCNNFECQVDHNSVLTMRNSIAECRTLDGNLYMIINNKMILSHIVVNLNSIMIYPPDHPSIPIDIPLRMIEEVRSSYSHPNCFKVRDSLGKVVYLCPPQDAVQNAVNEMNMCNSWVEHILELKKNCSQKMLSKIEKDISSSMNVLLDPSANEKKLLTLQKNIMNEENNHSRIKQSLLENQFEEFKTQTRDLLEKEDVYEKKLEEHERERIEGEESSMKKSAEKEQKIANQLLNDIQTIAVTDSNYNLKEQSIKREMKNMMEEVENNIVLKRQKLLNRIQRMRTLHELNLRKSGKDLLNMKRELGKKINLIAKTGNPSQCFFKDTYSINNYCKLNFEDFQLQLECKNEKQFCYICCDNEIGNLKKENLDCCYNRCDEVNSTSACEAFEKNFVQMIPLGVPIPHPALGLAPTPVVLQIDPSFNTA